MQVCEPRRPQSLTKKELKGRWDSSSVRLFITFVVHLLASSCQTSFGTTLHFQDVSQGPTGRTKPFLAGPYRPSSTTKPSRSRVKPAKLGSSRLAINKEYVVCLICPECASGPAGRTRALLELDNYRIARTRNNV